MPIPLVAAAIAGALVFMFHRGPARYSHPTPDSSADPIRSNTSAVNAKSSVPAHPSDRSEADRGSGAERLRVLERLGELPTNADLKDWELAQKTAWWGRPLDPKSFWRGKIVWCDASSVSSANRHGRMWPPMPYLDPALPPYPDDDGIHWNSGATEGPGIFYAYSSEEDAFWQRFNKTHPKPPEVLEEQQLLAAERILSLQNLAQSGRSAIPITPLLLEQAEASRTREAIQMGFPSEAFSEKALFWRYVLSRRQQYQHLSDQGQTAESPQMKALFQSLAVSREYITESLTDEQLKAASAWKIAYLQRLRREKTDESYINAYLQAWNLSADSVFNEGK